MQKVSTTPRTVLAALRGGAGKTFVTVGLISTLIRRGLSVAAFKKGPDYIDAGWLGLAAGSDCHNLDAYLFDENSILESVARNSEATDLAVVEGNRGLFDGVDSSGSYSTAEMAKLLRAPLILIVDCTKVTRTVAALVLGCKTLDPDLTIAGVILNRVGGARHERVLRGSIEEACGIPVVGAIKKLSLKNFPQRHLGLLPWHEHPRALAFVDEAAKVVGDHTDVDLITEIARSSAPLNIPAEVPTPQDVFSMDHHPLRIGVLRDSAFQFYYPENIQALQDLGADIEWISALEASCLPEIDALYIGGGFPETHAEKLADNSELRLSVFDHVKKGLPVYAECGGLMYLARTLFIDERAYPMVGALPVDTVLAKRPQGHGYIKAEVVKSNPFIPVGSVLTGHEFHYSYVTGLENESVSRVFKILRGHGLNGMQDGLCSNNVLATYLHVHALGEPAWARGLLGAAERYRRHHQS
jgi:cobyrinic acid a,c-diamide synthase